MSTVSCSRKGIGMWSDKRPPPPLPIYFLLIFAVACGHDIVLPPNGKIGSVHSPYFLSEYYEPDVACLWNVKASKGQRLKIKFDAINLSDNSGSCTYDYVMINSVRFCRAAPKGGFYITVDRDAKIIFRSAPGNAVKHGGFNFSIEAIGIHIH